jgi:hypothetical protein
VERSPYSDITRARGFYEAIGYEEQERVLMVRWLDGRPMTP